MKKIQAGYKAQTLSQFLKKACAACRSRDRWPKIDKKLADADPFAYLNFLLQFCPAEGPAEVEMPLRARFAKIGIEAGKPFAVASSPPEQKTALERASRAGSRRSSRRPEDSARTRTAGGSPPMASATDRHTHGDWTLRAAAAMAGIYGNDPAEALYPCSPPTATGNKPDCSKNRYTLTFPQGNCRRSTRSGR